MSGLQQGWEGVRRRQKPLARVLSGRPGSRRGRALASDTGRTRGRSTAVRIEGRLHRSSTKRQASLGESGADLVG